MAALLLTRSPQCYPRRKPKLKANLYFYRMRPVIYYDFSSVVCLETLNDFFDAKRDHVMTICSFCFLIGTQTSCAHVIHM